METYVRGLEETPPGYETSSLRRRLRRLPARPFDNEVNFIARYASKQQRLVVGLMSGTSADAIDAALVEISGSGLHTEIRLLHYIEAPYEPRVREAILRLFSTEARAADVCRMNFLLGELFAEAALEVIRAAGVKPSEVDLVASHGQTILHLAGPVEVAGRTVISTLQIGEPCVIAERTGITTVADFRARDIAAGGQGAPLVAFADFILFRDAEKRRAVQNIGGIANVTVIPAGAGIDDVFAFDTGPGNMIIDAVVTQATKGEKTFDRDGNMGARGQVLPDILEWLMSHPFLEKPPPKTTGREEFGAGFAREMMSRAPDARPEDLVATATAFTAESIAVSYRRFVLQRCEVEEVILGGGGGYNLTLRAMLMERLPEVQILMHEDFGLPGAAKEAMAFAILGNETMLGNPSNVPGATGASHPAVLGKIVPG
jgi:anhydro-N-acetylmuramic acid kinase